MGTSEEEITVNTDEGAVPADGEESATKDPIIEDPVEELTDEQKVEEPSKDGR